MNGKVEVIETRIDLDSIMESAYKNGYSKGVNNGIVIGVILVLVAGIYLRANQNKGS